MTNLYSITKFFAPRHKIQTLVLLTTFSTGMSHAQVSGDWDTTALTRIDVIPLDAPGLIPEHTVDTSKGIYQFAVNGEFNAGDIAGVWRQRTNQYTVKVDRSQLENQFRDSIQENDLDVIIHQLKLVKSSFSGMELDNGIWGNETYTYRIDSTLDGYRDVIRLVMTVRVVGFPHEEEMTGLMRAPTFSTKESNTNSGNSNKSQMNAAAVAVIKHLRGHPTKSEPLNTPIPRK